MTDGSNWIGPFRAEGVDVVDADGALVAEAWGPYPGRSGRETAADIAAALNSQSAMQAEIDGLRLALKPFAHVTITPDGNAVGMERHWFEAARAAWAKQGEAT